jgi:hypothetical protein
MQKAGIEVLISINVMPIDKSCPKVLIRCSTVQELNNLANHLRFNHSFNVYNLIIGIFHDFGTICARCMGQFNVPVFPGFTGTSG